MKGGPHPASQSSIIFPASWVANQYRQEYSCRKAAKRRACLDLSCPDTVSPENFVDGIGFDACCSFRNTVTDTVNRRMLGQVFLKNQYAVLL